MTNRDKFFKSIRMPLFGSSISAKQFAGMTAILDEWDKRELTDLRWLAYIMATAYHETGTKFQPVEENLNYSAQGLANTFPVRCSINPKDTTKKPNEKALQIARNPISIANYVYANKNGNGNESSGDGWKYRGIGMCQTTGRGNYKKFGCENNPEKMLDLNFSISTMFTGMINGVYTTVKLSDCFKKTPISQDETKNAPIKARLIINGRDKAALISGYYYNFIDALK